MSLDPQLDALVHLPFRDAYDDGGVRVTRNLGSLGGTVFLGADGTDAVNFPALPPPGRLRGAAFDGATDRMAVPAAWAPSFVSVGADLPFSIEATICLYGPTTNQTIASKGTLAAGREEYSLWFSGAGLYFALWDDALDYVGRSAPWPYAGGVYHIAATSDGTRTSAGCAIYSNAVRIDTANFAGGVYGGQTHYVEPLYIGFFPNVGTALLTVYHLTVWPRCLQPGEVAQLAARSRQLFNTGRA